MAATYEPFDLARRLRELNGNGAEDSHDLDELELQAEALARELASDRPPRVTQIVADDVTAEKLAGLLADQDGAAAVMSPEGGFFGNIGGRYGDIPSLETMLKGHACDDIRVNRQGRVGETVPRPA